MKPRVHILWTRACGDSRPPGIAWGRSLGVPALSNVLIGIIGVILFIGLALAGALILGDDFRSANNESRASAIVQTLQQVAAAGNMYRLKTGTALYEDGNALLVPRFLKAYPANPMVGATTDRRLQVKLSNGVDDNGAATPGAVANFASLRVYPENQKAADICRTIAEQASGQTLTAPPGLDATVLSRPFGCGYYGVTLYAFARM